jgi:putative ubiquitin-RnfH superfamily antitoxin RatB of RatAB toxin-antitoxin module
MLGIEGLPALIYTIMVFKIPNSPRWLLMKNHADAIVIESITLLGIAKDKASVHLEQIKVALFDTTEKKKESLFSGK